jgi:DNA polymerase III epsilon subunit-like protein
MSARKAMKFLEVHLRNKKYAIRGQRSDELFDKKNRSGGDDSILDCCLYFQQLTAKRLTLLSNDRNLCIKVMVHGVDSLSAESKSGLEALLNRVYQDNSGTQQHMDYTDGHVLADHTNQITTEDVVSIYTYHLFSCYQFTYLSTCTFSIWISTAMISTTTTQ